MRLTRMNTEFASEIVTKVVRRQTSCSFVPSHPQRSLLTETRFEVHAVQ
ncbi:hypothetical protein ACJH6H_29450 [Mycobacterium sp. SMC-21]